jgi:LPS export ABC transporter protein LptC/lipopolysaccharide transport protein LptA
MRPPATRLLRRILLGVVVLVALAVLWSLRRPSAPSRPAGSGSGSGEGTTIEDVSFFQFREGEEKVQLKAKAWTGQEDGIVHLEGVEVTFPYVSEGGEATATVTSDECFYDAAMEQALFRGNVHVVTSDGFELTSESLDYLGAEERVLTEEDVQFSRGRISGTARGAEYRSATDGIVLQKRVRLRFEDDEGGPPTEIEASRAKASRKTRLVRLSGGVEVRQGPRQLRSKQLQISLTEDLAAIRRAAAIEDVDVFMAPGAGLPGSAVPTGGQRRLRCRRLNVVYRQNGELKEIIAVQKASFEALPGPGEPPEKRRIEADRIFFDFDEQGRLHTLRSYAGGRQYQLSVLSSEPLSSASGAPRRVESRSALARLDPATGDLRSATFRGPVVFTEPGRQAWAGRASYREKDKRLLLEKNAPRIRDEADGSELQAEQIEVATDTGSLVAVEGVRHTIGRRGAEGDRGMLAGSEPTVLVCQRFEYDSEKKMAWYRENALLRSGQNEVRAPLIVLEDPAPGERRLRASEGVASLLHPRSATDAESEPAPVRTQSQEMVYEEKAGRVVYRGDVKIQQGDIATLSPEAVVTLTAGGDGVKKIVAGEPVEVRQGPRHATGQTGTYTPSDETMLLEGDEVVLQDVGRQVRGKVLTFKVGEDRIRLDGREEVRTEAIFKNREPPKP